METQIEDSYWCHLCGKTVEPKLPELLCSECNSDFIEKIEQEDDRPEDFIRYDVTQPTTVSNIFFNPFLFSFSFSCLIFIPRHHAKDLFSFSFTSLKAFKSLLAPSFVLIPLSSSPCRPMKVPLPLLLLLNHQMLKMYQILPMHRIPSLKYCNLYFLNLLHLNPINPINPIPVLNPTPMFFNPIPTLLNPIQTIPCPLCFKSSIN